MSEQNTNPLANASQQKVSWLFWEQHFSPWITVIYISISIRANENIFKSLQNAYYFNKH